MWWMADMIEPYRNGRYDFQEQYLMRIAQPLRSGLSVSDEPKEKTT